MTHRVTVALAFVSACILLSACGEQRPAPVTSANANEHSWILTSSPEGALSVIEAKGEAFEGEPIVLRGRIGGRSQPISDESPVFTLVDLSLPHCGVNPEDGCPTPWDYCCETPETIAAHAATVQVVDRNNRPLSNLNDAAIKPLDEVVVVGTVASRSEEKILTVRATGLYLIEE